jgi:hypothetical protein
MKKYDSINQWLDENTAMFGQPLSYQERIEDCILARGEQIQPRTKRFIYSFYHQQEQESSNGWMHIGDYEVDNQEELWELDEKFSKKYKSAIKYNKIKSYW